MVFLKCSFSLWACLCLPEIFLIDLLFFVLQDFLFCFMIPSGPFVIVRTNSNVCGVGRSYDLVSF